MAIPWSPNHSLHAQITYQFVGWACRNQHSVLYWFCLRQAQAYLQQTGLPRAGRPTRQVGFWILHKAIINYFDALLLGLTALPKEDIDHDTYNLFDAEQGSLTYAYGLDQAVHDWYLAPPKNIRILRACCTIIKKPSKNNALLGFMYRGPGSNRHGHCNSHWILSPTCLPIPPPRRKSAVNKPISGIYQLV